MTRSAQSAAHLKRIKTQRLSERVAQALSERLDRGEWAIGQRLPTEHTLAAMFDVSRTVVREAISRLRQAGRLETIQGSGTFVTAPPHSTAPEQPAAVAQAPVVEQAGADLAPGALRASLTDLVAVLELRRGLEAEAASMAARRRTHQQIMQMRHAVQRLTQAAAAGSPGVEDELRLPMQVAIAARNPLYVRQLEQVHRFLLSQPSLAPGPDSVADPRWHRDRPQQIIDEQRALLDAIACGDAARARREAIRHLLNAELRLRNATRVAEEARQAATAVPTSASVDSALPAAATAPAAASARFKPAPPFSRAPSARVSALSVRAEPAAVNQRAARLDS